MAEAMMVSKDYPEVAGILKSALVACRSIHSIQNTATILDMYSRLAIGPYGTSTNVQEIGAMLKEGYPGA